MERNRGHRGGWAVTVAALGCAVGCGLATAEAGDLLAITVEGAADSPAARGVELGVAEANAQGRYFGRRFEIRYLAAGASPGPGAPPGVAIVVSAEGGGGDGDETAETERRARWERWGGAAAAGWLVLNAVDRDDALRHPCREGLLHVIPSSGMLAEALRQKSGSRPPEGLRAQAWHASLFRFAARDLNARYRDRFALPMEPEAWAGWAAARAVGEAALRAESGDPRRLRRYFREELALDGQKGVALRFASDGQLWQPVYLVAENRVWGEFAPPRPESAAEKRSSHGETASREACP